MPDPRDVEPGHISKDVSRVVPPGELADRHRPIEADLAGLNGLFNIRQLQQVSARRDQVSCRLRGDIETAPHPLTQRPTPRPHRQLPPIRLTQ